MDTWRLVDAGVFFTFFFYSFLFGLFFFFLGDLANFFLPNCPIASTIRSIQIFLDPVQVFLLSFLGLR